MTEAEAYDLAVEYLRQRGVTPQYGCTYRGALHSHCSRGIQGGDFPKGIRRKVGISSSQASRLRRRTSSFAGVTTASSWTTTRGDVGTLPLSDTAPVRAQRGLDPVPT